MRTAWSWALAALAAVALATGAVATYAEHTVFRAGGFDDRVAAGLQRAPVREALAHHLTDAAIGARPDLVAVRPLILVAARSVAGSSAFRSLVRRAARGAHDRAFREDRTRVSAQILDAGLLLAATLRRFRSDDAGAVPSGLRVRVAKIGGGVNGFFLRLAEVAAHARVVAPIAFAAALVLALAALLVSDSRRAAVMRLGGAVAVVSGAVAAGAALGPGLAAAQVSGLDDQAVRALASTWLTTLVAWAAAAGAAGAVVALAAASVLRPIAVGPLARRLWGRARAWTPGARGRAAVAAATLALGVAMVVAPRAVLTVVVVAIGVAAALAAILELLSLAAGEPRSARRHRAPRVGAVAGVLALAALVTGALAARGGPDAPKVGRCNGHRSLCDRRLDQVAFLGTHNSMAATGEPGWLFAAQDDGIAQQLGRGVRALLIDTHYGFPTARGVVTDLSGPTKSRGKLEDALSGEAVAVADRLRTRAASAPRGARKVFLCHAFCEVGATDATAALTAVHRYLVAHPEEVLLLSIEDDTSARDTAAVIRRSGLVDEVYRGPARAPWPTLGELIERDERVVVLVEDDPGGEPWMHRQSAVAQETPYHFPTTEALAEPSACRPNRGGTEGSLLLLNHWVDTSPAPRPTIARRVNAAGFLEQRLAACRAAGRKTPNIVALDFYRQGDGRRVVDELNGGS